MRIFRFMTLLVLGLALMGATANVSAQQANVYVTATHSDLKGVFCSLAASTGANNTVWNNYVWAGSAHPSLYGVTIVGFQPFPSLAADFASPFTREGDLWVSTVELLEGVTWSDGTEVTAEDVAFTMNMFATVLPTGNTLSLELGGGWAVPVFDKVDHVEAVDRYTVKFYMTEKPGLADWEFTLLLWDVFQKDFWEPKFNDAMATDDPVAALSAIECPGEPSAGPFVTKQWQPGAFAEIEANPNYYFKGTVSREYEGGGYEEVLPDGTTRSMGDTGAELLVEYETGPFVDGVIFNLFGTQQAGALAVISGDADYHFNPLGYGLATLRQLEDAENVRVIKNPDNGVFYLSFNMRKSPFNYVEFRRAVRCVIDKEFVANSLLQGQVIPAYSPVPPALTAFHRPLTEEDQEVACIGMSEEERLARARQMLEDAGFTFEGGRLAQDPEGNAIGQLELLHPNAAYDNNRNIFGLHIVDRLQKLGVPVRDVPAGFNNIVTLVFDEQDFDMWQLGWSLGAYVDYLEAFFHSRNTAPGGNSPQGGVCSARENEATGCQEAYDELADQFVGEQDADKSVEQARELQRLVFEWAAYVPTHYVQAQDAWRTDAVSYQGLEDVTLLEGIHGFTGLKSMVQKAK